MHFKYRDGSPVCAGAGRNGSWYGDAKQDWNKEGSCNLYAIKQYRVKCCISLLHAQLDMRQGSPSGARRKGSGKSQTRRFETHANENLHPIGWCAGLANEAVPGLEERPLPVGTSLQLPAQLRGGSLVSVGSKKNTRIAFFGLARGRVGLDARLLERVQFGG